MAHVVGEIHLRKIELGKAQETHGMLINYEDDLSFDLRRVTKEL